jgi:multidrug efflux pump subunit AcrA (membrane-fusion protein)
MNLAKPWLLIPLGLLAGVGLFALSIINSKAPQQSQTPSPPLAVRVIEAQPLAFVYQAQGHGLSRAAETWQASATVAGRVIWQHDDLDDGKLLPAGTELLRLDPSRHELALAAAEAELAKLEAERLQLQVEEDNSRRLLVLEQERLALAEQELKRIEELAQSGAASRTNRDEQTRATLAQRQAVLALENQLRLLPSRLQALQAAVDAADSRRGQAQRDLQDTRFVAPYDLRLSQVEIGLHQQAAVGQRLFRADSIERAEIEAQIPLDQLMRLISAITTGTDAGEAPLSLDQRLHLAQIRAEVSLAGFPDVRWQAQVSRIGSGLDPATRSARVVVSVERPYADLNPPQRPALQPGMYLQVRLSVPSPEARLVIPRTALKANQVLLADAEDRLLRRSVDLDFVQQDLAVIRSGLKPGDRLLLDEPQPAPQGMALQPIRDEAAQRRLVRQAQAVSADKKP